VPGRDVLVVQVPAGMGDREIQPDPAGQPLVEDLGRLARRMVADRQGPAQDRRHPRFDELLAERRQRALARGRPGEAAGQEQEPRKEVGCLKHPRDVLGAGTLCMPDAVFEDEDRPVSLDLGVAGEVDHVEVTRVVGIDPVRQALQAAAFLDHEVQSGPAGGLQDQGLFTLEIQYRLDIGRGGGHEQDAQGTVPRLAVGQHPVMHPPHGRERPVRITAEKAAAVLQQLPGQVTEALCSTVMYRHRSRCSWRIRSSQGTSVGLSQA